MKNTRTAILRPLTVCAGAFALASLLAVGANAAVGDIAGEIFESDIKTYVFGKPINSYNIGGKTVIVAEDLMMFGTGSGSVYDYLSGINVTWDTGAMPGQAVSPQLKLADGLLGGSRTDKLSAEILADTVNPNYPEGYFEREAPKHYLETDIETYFLTPTEKKKLTSYNIGGQTCIIVEELAEVGYNVVWNPEERTLTVNHRFDNQPTEIDIGEVYFTDWSRGESLAPIDYIVTVDGEQSDITMIANGTFNHSYFVELDAICKATGIEYSFDGSALKLDTQSARPFTLERAVPLAPNELPTMFRDKFFHIDIDSFYVNGIESIPTYSYFTGHFEWTRRHTKPLPALCLNGVTYIGLNYIEEIIENSK